MYLKNVITGYTSGTLYLVIPLLDFDDVAGLDPYTHLIKSQHCPYLPSESHVNPEGRAGTWPHF